MAKTLFIVLIASIVGLLSNIVATWLEPVASKRKTLTITLFIIFTIIAGFFSLDGDQDKVATNKEKPNIVKISKDKVSNNAYTKQKKIVASNNVKNDPFPQFLITTETDVQDIKFIPNTHNFVSVTKTDYNLFSENKQGYLEIWNCETGQKIKTLATNDNGILNNINIPESGNVVYSYSKIFNKKEYPSLACINVQSGEIEKAVSGPTIGDEPTLVSNDNKVVIYSTHDELLLYDNVTNKITSIFSWKNRLETYEYITSITLSRDNKKLVAATVAGSIYLIDIHSGKLLAGWKDNNEIIGVIHEVQFLADNKHFITVGEKVNLWSLEDEIKITRNYNVERSSYHLQIFERNDILITVGEPITIFRLSSGQKIATINTPYYFRASTLSSSGRYLITSGNNVIAIWDIEKILNVE